MELKESVDDHPDDWIRKEDVIGLFQSKLDDEEIGRIRG
jgi:hypothetical protein